MDDKLWGNQAIYPSFIQLTCGGNIVKGVHDKKPISLTPWLALKTFWATDRETVKKQQMTRERRENRMGENAHVFFWKKKIFFGLAPLEFPASAVIWEGKVERTESDWCQIGQLVKSWSTDKRRPWGTANTGTACQMFEHFQSSKHLPNHRVSI